MKTLTQSQRKLIMDKIAELLKILPNLTVKQAVSCIAMSYYKNMEFKSQSDFINTIMDELTADEPICRCNNCMTHFESDEDLKILIKDGEGYKGCPICLTDKYLMDI